MLDEVMRENEVILSLDLGIKNVSNVSLSEIDDVETVGIGNPAAFWTATQIEASWHRFSG
jgi:hypothetical protein